MIWEFPIQTTIGVRLPPVLSSLTSLRILLTILLTNPSVRLGTNWYAR